MERKHSELHSKCSQLPPFAALMVGTQSTPQGGEQVGHWGPTPCSTAPSVLLSREHGSAHFRLITQFASPMDLPIASGINSVGCFAQPVSLLTASIGRARADGFSHPYWDAVGLAGSQCPPAPGGLQPWPRPNHPRAPTGTQNSRSTSPAPAQCVPPVPSCTLLAAPSSEQSHSGQLCSSCPRCVSCGMARVETLGPLDWAQPHLLAQPCPSAHRSLLLEIRL